MMLDIDQSNTTRGVLAILQVLGERQGSPWRYYLKPPEVAALEQMGRQEDAPACTSVGVRSRGNTGLTFKDLCLLHLRDSTSKLVAPNLAVADRSQPVSWTDLKEFIRTQGSKVARNLTRLHEQGWLERERLEFYRDALDFLDEHPGARVIDDVYRAVWSYEFLEADGYYFRGQRKYAWRLDTTFYRLPPDSPSLELPTLVDRVQGTSLFVAELRRRQSEIFGREPSDDELLAVAQHYGLRFADGERVNTDRPFSRTFFPNASLAGARNAAFDEQVDEAADFFALLSGVAAQYDCATLVKDLVATIQEYFADTRSLAELGALSSGQRSESSSSPFDRALARFCQQAGSPYDEVSKVLDELKPNWDDDWTWRVPDSKMGGERPVTDWLALPAVST